eukprot:UN23083
MGSRVRIVEKVDRRVRIDQPIAGWCSLKSSNGDTILTALDQEEVAQQTPKGSVKNKWDREVKNYQQQQAKADSETQKKKALINSNSTAKELYELTNELKQLKQQVQQKQLTEEERRKNESELQKTKQAVDNLKDSTNKEQAEIK